MFRIFGSISIAFGLIFFASLAQAQDQRDATLESQPVADHGQEKSATAGAESTSDKVENTLDYTSALESIESAIRELIADEDEVESERKKNQEKRDLDAQEQMASWAKRMFWATAATVLLTFGALCAIVRTLHHTHRAAVAAEDAVEITRNIGRAQTSAYLDIDGGSYTINKLGISGYINLVNNGYSVARRITCETTISITPIYNGGMLVKNTPKQDVKNLLSMAKNPFPFKRSFMTPRSRSKFYFHWTKGDMGKETFDKLSSDKFVIVFDVVFRYFPDGELLKTSGTGKVKSREGFVVSETDSLLTKGKLYTQ